MIPSLRTCVALLSGVLEVAGQTRLHTVRERLQLFENYQLKRASEITSTRATALADPVIVRQNRGEWRRQLRYALGLEPMPLRGPLKPQVIGHLERGRYRIEKVVFQSMPGLYVTGDLYLPRVAGRNPAVLYLCGHAPGPFGAKVHYQHHGIWLASHGYVAFLIDTIEFGEIPGIHHGLYDLEMWNWLSLGYTPAGPEVWNAIRAVDYLYQRPEVDTARIAVTGISGGGAITWYAAAVDERLVVAAPVCSTWTAGSQVSENSVKENCDCIYFPNTFGFDLPMVGALIAPRSLKTLGAQRDEMFPPSGYREVDRQLSALYAAQGVPQKFASYEYDAHHEDIPPFRKQVDEWIDRWFKNSVNQFDESDIQRNRDEDLAVLAERPPDAINDRIQDAFIHTAKRREWPTLPEWKKHRQTVLADLKDKTFRAFPASAAPFNSVRVRDTGWIDRYAETWNIEFTSESPVRITGQLSVPSDPRRRETALIYIKGPDDLIESIDYDLILPALGKQIVLTLVPRGVDYPVTRSGLATLKRTAALLGGTLESMQVYDILRAVDYLQSDPTLKPRFVSVFGRKEMGALGIYAALLDSRIGRVIVDNPPATHWDRPALLNVLRITDLPETAAMVAPRQLVSLTPLPWQWNYAHRVYALYGKPRALREAHGMADAIRVLPREQ